MASPVVDTAGAQSRLHAHRGSHGTRHGSFPVKALCDAIPPASSSKGRRKANGIVALAPPCVQDAREEPSFEVQRKMLQLVVHRSVPEAKQGAIVIGTSCQRGTAEVWP